MELFLKKLLQTYLQEKRILSSAEYPSDILPFLQQKNAAFVTMFLGEKVVASQGRIQCKKENTLAEIIDLTMSCIAENRFNDAVDTPETLEQISIRIDVISPDSRRILKDISELNITNEGIILLSQKLGKLAVVLPNMIKNLPTSQKYLSVAEQKAQIPENTPSNEYVIYGLKTQIL